ncbi:MAG: VOC family protein [Acidimicrobiaceae bacterium]|nr:VOC family protein [Acidimicrobiaceae bacterium]
MSDAFPFFRSVVLDSTDVRGLAEFYRQLLGYTYRSGDEPPAAGEDDALGRDFLMLEEPGGRRRLAFQHVDELPTPTWPREGVPQQLHLDLSVPDRESMEAQRDRALSLGATILDADRSDDPDEPIYVFADPSGHPFCIFVVAPGASPV